MTPTPDIDPDGRRVAGAGVADELSGLLTASSVLVCVGQALRGDDGAAPALAEAIDGTVCWPVFNAQTAPESFLGKIVAAQPEVVLVIDTLDVGAPAGSVRLFGPEQLTGIGPSTHGPAPLTFIEALRLMHPCRCRVLGIQPQCTELGAPLSAPVAAAVQRVAGVLRRLSAG